MPSPIDKSLRRLTACATIFFIVLLSGCYRASDDDVVGQYVVVYPFGTESLTIKKDGSYLQAISTKKRSISVTHSGKWTFDSSSKVLRLYNPVLADDNFGKLRDQFELPVDGSWNLSLSKHWGKVILSWNPDQECEFQKTK